MYADDPVQFQFRQTRFVPEMTSAETKLRKLTRWKAKKPYSDRLTLLYWRYSHQVHGALNSTGPW